MITAYCLFLSSYTSFLIKELLLSLQLCATGFNGQHKLITAEHKTNNNKNLPGGVLRHHSQSWMQLRPKLLPHLKQPQPLLLSGRRQTWRLRSWATLLNPFDHGRFHGTSSRSKFHKFNNHGQNIFQSFVLCGFYLGL